MLIFFGVLVALFSWLLNDNFIVKFLAEYVSVFYYDICQMRDYTGNGCSPAILGRNFHFIFAFVAAFIITGIVYRGEIQERTG